MPRSSVPPAQFQNRFRPRKPTPPLPYGENLPFAGQLSSGEEAPRPDESISLALGMPFQHSFDSSGPLRRMGRLVKQTDAGGQLLAQFPPHVLFQFGEQAKRQRLQLRVSLHPFEQVDSGSVWHFRIRDYHFREWINFSPREGPFSAQVTFGFMRVEYVPPFCPW